MKQLIFILIISSNFFGQNKIEQLFTPSENKLTNIYFKSAYSYFKDIPDSLSSIFFFNKIDKAIKLDSLYAPCYYIRGRAYVKSNKIQAAKNDFEKVINLTKSAEFDINDVGGTIVKIEMSNNIDNNSEKILDERLKLLETFGSYIIKKNNNIFLIGLPNTSLKESEVKILKFIPTGYIEFFETMYLSDPEIADKCADADKLSKESFDT
ncbi:MAG: hypothetical protein P8I93_09400 [Crocinitomicaceae bacterium]|nr:hypothetical protein [Crocinitomicaceae bacterium]